MSYIFELRDAFRDASKDFRGQFKLFGPAGLFRKESTHPFCWASLRYCNDNPSRCPFDVISFHRKGQGAAYEILDNGLEVFNEIIRLFPNMKKKKFGNTYVYYSHFCVCYFTFMSIIFFL